MARKRRKNKKKAARDQSTKTEAMQPQLSSDQTVKAPATELHGYLTKIDRVKLVYIDLEEITTIEELLIAIAEDDAYYREGLYHPGPSEPNAPQRKITKATNHGLCIEFKHSNPKQRELLFKIDQTLVLAQETDSDFAKRCSAQEVEILAN